jgi:hypothetical protein
MLVNGSGRNEHYLLTTFHICFLPSFGSFGQAVSEEKIFKNRPIRNKNCLWRPCLLMDRDKMSLNTKSNGNVFVECQEMLSTKIDWNDVLNVTGNVFVECHRKYTG